MGSVSFPGRLANIVIVVVARYCPHAGIAAKAKTETDEPMEVQLILCLSIVLQLTAAFLALRLIRVTGRRWAWVFVAGAITLMALRRVVTGSQLWLEPGTASADIYAEFIALLISCLMLAGVALIGPLFSVLRRSEAQAAEGEARYRTLAETSPVGIIRTLPNGRCSYVNDQWCHVTGLPREQNLEDGWLQGIHPDQRDGVHRDWYEAVSRGCSFKSEVPFVGADGKTTWVYFQASPVLDGAGQMTGHVGTITDITEQRAVEQALRKSERQLREAQQVAKLGSWDLDVKTNDLSWSDEVYRIFGLQPQSFGATYEAFLQAVHPEDRGRVVQAVNTALNEGKPYRIDHRIVLPSGEVRHVSERAEVTADASGQPVRMIGTVLDITERVHAEQAVRKEHERSQQYLDLVEVIILALNVDGVVTSINRKGRTMLGLSESEIVGQSWFDKFLPPDVRDVVRASFAEVAAGVRPPRQRYENPILAGNGEVRLITWMNTLLKDENGNITGTLSAGEDITEQRQTEEELRNFFSLAPDMFCITNADGHFNLVNAAFRQTLGFSESEMLGVPLLDYVHADDRQHTAAVLGRLSQGLPVTQFVNRFRCKDGTYRWIEWNAKRGPSRDVLYAAARDITERKRADEAIRESEARFRQLAENTEQVFWLTDWVDKKLIYVSPSYERLFGRTCASLFEDRHSWHEVIHPAERDRVARAFAQKAQQGEYCEEEYRIIHPDKGERWILDRAFPLVDETGRVYRIVGLAEDITARRRAEQRFRDLLEFAPDAIIIADEQAKIVFINARTESLFGYERDELLGQSVERLTAGEQHRRRLIDQWNKTLAPQAPAKTAELEIRGLRKDGREFPADISLGPIDTRGGRLVASAIRDVTDRKLAERERQQLESQLRQSQKMEAVGQLASGVAHDFNNLLTVIAASATMIKAPNAESNDVTASLERIERAVEQATHVTRSLLTFGRRVPAEKRPINLCLAVVDAVRMLEHTLPAAIDLRVDVSCDPPPWVHADPAAVQQIILNLVVNARDAMPEGGTLHLTATKHVCSASTPADASARSAGRLIVSDTGCGMTDEVLSRLYEPFFTTKPREHGTGLGMAVVHGIVKEHDGRIDVLSRPGKGTMVTIDLPLVAVDADEDTTSPRPVVPKGNGQVVLLAEDQAQVREVVAATLTTLGYQVVQAGDGDALLRQFERHRDRIRLFVLDVDLPKRNGLDCLDRIRMEGVSAPAIVITGSADVELIGKKENTVLLHKPFLMSDLGKHVEQMIQ